MSTRAAWELDRFQRRFPEAAGELSGRRAPWSKLLGDLLETSRTWPERRASDAWTQFAANSAARGASVPGSGHRRSPAVASRLDAALPSRGVARRGRTGDGGTRRRFLPFHPIVLGPYVALQDGGGVRVWQASTGAPAFPGDERAAVFASPVPSAWLAAPGMRVTGVPRFPLSSDGETLWARVGAPWLSSDRPTGSDLLPARLVALDLAAEGRAQAAWPLDAARFGEEWTWEGPPVCVDGLVYVGLRRCDPVQAQSHVACFDASTGTLRWRRFIAAASAPRARAVEWTQHLLTWYEGRLFYHARVGVVACLNPQDGVIEWLTRYPRAVSDLASVEQDELFRQRDLTPCLVHQGLVWWRRPTMIACSRWKPPRDKWSGSPTERAPSTPCTCWGSRRDMCWRAAKRCTGSMSGPGGCAVSFHPRERCARRGTPRIRKDTDAASWPIPRSGGRRANACWSSTRRPQRRRKAGVRGPIRQIDLASRGATGGNLAAAGGMLFIAGPDRLYAFGE